MQNLLEHVTNGTLGVRAAEVQRNFVKLVGRDFRAAQDETNLRTISVGNDHIPAVNDHFGDVFHRLDCSLILIGD